MKKTAKPGFVKSCVQACARWAGIPLDAGDGTQWNLGDTRLSAANQCVTTGTAMQISAVYACVSLLADTISTLPLNLYKRTPEGREPAVDHPLYAILRRQPNKDQTSAQFLGALVASMLLRDAGYAEKLIVNGRAVGMEFLKRDCLQITRRLDGTLEYAYTEYGKRRVIPTSRIWKIPGFSLDGYNGCSAIRYGARVFGNAMAADQAAESTFSKGLLPTTFFKYPTVLKDSQRADARKAIQEISGALNAGNAAILEAGMEAGELGIDPADAQLLESRAFSVEEICSWFRVQPFMIGRASQGQTNWGTGIEQQMIGFITFTLAPWLRRIEQGIVKDVLSPADKDIYYAEFALEGLLRGDSKARSEFYASALQNGWMSRNQVAKLENFPPIPGGDVFTVQSNLIPIDQLGAATPDKTVRSALLTWLTEENKNGA